MQLSEIPLSGLWGEPHLLGLERLSSEQLTTVLDLAAHYDQITHGGTQRLDVLRGQVVANLFFENSTRTRTSFSLAARRLGADTVDFSASSSSLSKLRRSVKAGSPGVGHYDRSSDPTATGNHPLPSAGLPL